MKTEGQKTVNDALRRLQDAVENVDPKDITTDHLDWLTMIQVKMRKAMADDVYLTRG